MNGKETADGGKDEWKRDENTARVFRKVKNKNEEMALKASSIAIKSILLTQLPNATVGSLDVV